MQPDTPQPRPSRTITDLSRQQLQAYANAFRQLRPTQVADTAASDAIWNIDRNGVQYVTTDATARFSEWSTLTAAPYRGSTSVTRSRKATEKPRVLSFLQTGLPGRLTVDTTPDGLQVLGSYIQDSNVVFKLRGDMIMANKTRANHLKQALRDFAAHQNYRLVWTTELLQPDTAVDTVVYYHWPRRQPIDDSLLIAATRVLSALEPEPQDEDDDDEYDDDLPF